MRATAAYRWFVARALPVQQRAQRAVYGMPELGGREMVSGIRESRPGIPVVFMSGYTDDEIMRRQLDEPGITFLSKPFTPDALLDAVEECATRGMARCV